MTNGDVIPDAPKFSDEDMQRCRDTGDYASLSYSNGINLLRPCVLLSFTSVHTHRLADICRPSGITS